MSQTTALQDVEHHLTVVLPFDQATEGVRFVGDTDRYVARFVKGTAENIGSRLKIHRVVPLRDATTPILCKEVRRFLHRSLLCEAGLLEHLSLLKQHPQLRKPGFKSPVIAIRSDLDPRCVLITCDEYGEIEVEAQSTKTSHAKWAWAPHSGLTFAGFAS